MSKDEELRRRVNENLVAIRSGRVAREVEREKELAAQKRAHRKANEKRAKVISRTLKELSKEREGLAEYLDELLLREDPNPLGYAEGMSESQYNGLLEECDAALQGCDREIADLTEELKGLLS